MVEEFQNGREVGLALTAVRESIVALRDQMDASIAGLRDQLTNIKWVMGGFATASVAAFGYFYFTTTQLSVAVARIDKHLESVDARLDSVDKRFEAVDARFEALEARMDKRFEAVDARFEALEARMDKRFDVMDKRFDTLTTLILNWQPLQKRTEGFGSRQ
jgi:flagellar capping protein FliD